MKKTSAKELYALLLVMASFLALILEVISRYILGSSIEWSDEIARLLLIWMTFTGIGLAILERKEIFVQTIRQKLSEKANKNLRISLDLLAIAFNLFLLIFGLQMTHFSWGMKSESLALPFSFFYAAIPAGSIIALFFLVKRIRETWGQPLEEKK